MMASQLVPVRFAGEGSGVESLAWGQWELWEGLDRLRTWMPIGFTRPLPEGTTIDQVASDLKFMMERYQTMRTRLRFGPDGPQQVVEATGEVLLEVVDGDDAADPGKLAEQVERRLSETGYDFTTDWPVRMAVVRHYGRPTHLVTVVCHLVTDAGGGAVMGRELAERDPASGAAQLPPAAMQPLAQARWQRSSAGRRQSQLALRYWEDLLRAIPAERFPGQGDARQPRYWQAGFRSVAAHLAIQAIAARSQVATAPVLLTVFCVALARLTGQRPVATRVIVDNRFRPGLADVVAPLAQAGLLVVDVAGLSFEAALARTRRRALVGYKYAYFDAARIYRLVEQVGRERGEPVHLGCFFNDRRSRARREAMAPPAGRAVPTAREIDAARAHTTLCWEGQQEDPFEELFLHVDDVADALDLTALTDTRFLGPPATEALLWEMEAVAVAAAADPATPTTARPTTARPTTARPTTARPTTARPTTARLPPAPAGGAP